MDSLSSVAGSMSTAFTRPTSPSQAGPPVEAAVAQQSAAPGEIHLRVVQSAQSSEQTGLSDKQNQDDKQPVEQAVKDINEFFQNVNRTLEFNVDQDSGRMVVQIKDSETKKVIRQIPPEYVIKLAKQLGEVKGLLFEEKA
jgi:flagellar protein FlaG